MDLSAIPSWVNCLTSLNDNVPVIEGGLLVPGFIET